MYKWISRKLFGSENDRTLKRITPLVPVINGLESRVEALTDDQLRAKTAEFKEKLSQGASLDDILPEAFAVVREASRRTTKMRHFDVQLIGGIVLHQGKIAEMKTGEGKTLVATLPAYLNALAGQGVHIVTVNDYLAKRDTEWMGAIYRFLGLTVGTIQHDLGDADRYTAYRADITYGTNNEFGFDYLRDNMKFRLADLAQREFNYAIVDEVDSILIDEARTPLIISGPTNESTQLYTQVDSLVRRFQKDKHFTLDEKTRTVSIQEAGVAEAERVLGVANLYDLANMEFVHAINTALKAHHLFKRDVDYMVQDGKVVIVDEFTGRLMPGRRYSDGLHQALEAKERRQGRGGEPDPGLDHLPELLPHVQEAGRHDGHRRDRGRRSSATSTASTSSRSRPTRPSSGWRTPTSSTGRARRNGTPSPRRSSTSTPRAGPSSSARSRSRNPSTSARSSAARTSGTSSSTPSTTSRRPRSSPRPAASGP